MVDAFEFAIKAAKTISDNRWAEWGLCDEFSIEHAALLSSGYFPDDYPWGFSEWEVGNWPDGLYPTYTAIQNAVTGGHLSANIVYRKEFVYQVERSVIDTAATTVLVDDLYNWFKDKNKTPYIFGLLRTRLKQTEDKPDLPGYLNKNHDCFSIKLKAAIDAWEAISEDPPITNSPKEAVKAWLRKNAQRYNLTKDNGNPNETGIEEIAKIVHWRTKGGALKTPVSDEKHVAPELEDKFPF